MNSVIIEEQPDNGITIVNGREWMEDAKGHLVPLANVKPEDKLQDETVRKIIGFAKSLSAQIARFKKHTIADISAFDALLEQEYGQKIGGKKGNSTYSTIDGRMRVVVQFADQVSFGPQIHIAKALIDECLTEWSADARPEIQSIVTRAFNTDKEGQINKAEIFMLLRLDIDDERWQRAMDAIRDSIRVTGSKGYIRFYERENGDDELHAITIDLAKA
ncbi:DUF3164 family protein [Rhizobium halophytocola]|uniref:DUF3164 family protein n=1 Tax=Rhizobium halophytocola TaxID=735519 RepID=A0ABS4E482_9HYPH|nr:DUF3164 family protein [Rhizobium halophytocola]MBP1852709.1 hypothetical protein [Rhizobium halophytocola]